MAQHLDRDKGSLDNVINSRQFLYDLQQFHTSRGTPFSRAPQLAGRDVDLWWLYRRVIGLGGWLKVTNDNKWEELVTEFRIPPGCTNGATLLKHIYIRYLDIYEKINFLGVDPSRPENSGDDEAPARKKASSSLIYGVPLVYNSRQHVVSEYTRESLGMCVDSKERNKYNNLIMSLLSGLPNEVDFAMNVCLLLSNEGKHCLKVNHCANLLSILLAHVGIFDVDSKDNLEDCVNSFKPYVKRDFKQFWHDSVYDESIRHLLLTENCLIYKESTSDENPLNLRRSVDCKDAESQRVMQVAVILRNLSFDDENCQSMSANSIVLRFLLLGVYSCCGSLKQLCFDALGNLSKHIHLKNLNKDLSKLLLKTTFTCLACDDKFDIVRGLEILGNLCQEEVNEDILLDSMEHKSYEDIARNLSVLDIQLIVFTLETLYQLSELGETCTTHIASIKHVVETLVNLVTIEAQSYGPQALVGIKVVEYINPPNVNVQGELPTERNEVESLPVPVSHIQEPRPGTPTRPPPTPKQGTPHQFAPPTPSNTPQPTNNSESILCNWLKNTYVPETSVTLGQLTMYSDYLNYCNTAGLKTFVGAATFNNCLKVTFPSIELRTITQRDGKKDICAVGLRKIDAIPKYPIPVSHRDQPVLCRSSGLISPTGMTTHGSPNSNIASPLRKQLCLPPMSPRLYSSTVTPASITDAHKSEASIVQPSSTTHSPSQLSPTIKSVYVSTDEPTEHNHVSQLVVSQPSGQRINSDYSLVVKDRDTNTNLIKTLLVKKLNRNNPQTVNAKLPLISEVSNSVADTVTTCAMSTLLPSTTQNCLSQSILSQNSFNARGPNSRPYRHIAPHPRQYQPILPNPSSAHILSAISPQQSPSNSTLKSKKRKRAKSPVIGPLHSGNCHQPSPILPASSNLSQISLNQDIGLETECVDGMFKNEVPIEKVKNFGAQSFVKDPKKCKPTKAKIFRNRVKNHRDGRLSGVQDCVPGEDDYAPSSSHRLSADLSRDTISDSTTTYNNSLSSKLSIVVNLDSSLIERMPAPSPKDQRDGNVVQDVMVSLLSNIEQSCANNLLPPYLHKSNHPASNNQTLVISSNHTETNLSQTQNRTGISQTSNSCSNSEMEIEYISNSNSCQILKMESQERINHIESGSENFSVANGYKSFTPSPVSTDCKKQDHCQKLVNGLNSSTDHVLDDVLPNKLSNVLDNMIRSSKINGIINHINSIEGKEIKNDPFISKVYHVTFPKPENNLDLQSNSANKHDASTKMDTFKKDMVKRDVTINGTSQHDSNDVERSLSPWSRQSCPVKQNAISSSSSSPGVGFTVKTSSGLCSPQSLPVTMPISVNVSTSVDVSTSMDISSPLTSPTLECSDASVAVKSLPSPKKRSRPRPKPRVLGTDGKPLKTPRSRKPTRDQSLKTPPLKSPPAPTTDLMCEWDNCCKMFDASKAVVCHVYSLHLRNYAGSTCLWSQCDGLERSKWSLITHVQDHHCSEVRLRIQSKARKEAESNTSVTNESSASPTPPQSSAPLVYPPDAAIQAIRRFAARQPYQELIEAREGPVTKHIRLTSSLILRNLARYSATGRSMIKPYEQRLSYIALSTVESSGALADCLWAAINNH